MKYLAAYALLSLSGKKDISTFFITSASADLRKILASVNANVSDDDLNRLIDSLKGKDLNKLIATGLSKIGGAGSAPTAGSSKPAPQ